MSNPVVLITGALTGIGRATAIAFAKEGARLVVAGRREDAAILRPGELTGAVQIVQTAFTGDGKSYAYAVRRMASHLFLVQKGE